MKVQLLPCGDRAVTVQLGDEIQPEVNARVMALYTLLDDESLPGIIELVPTYCALTVQYDPLVLPAARLYPLLEDAAARAQQAPRAGAVPVELPVLYGSFCGPDLDFVSHHAGLDPDEVVRIHSGTDYLIYMLGFTPGFPYLGGMDERISSPRLETPRVKIPAGSVGIAGSQTGVYPIASPGGWRIIGRTPLRLFNPSRSSPFLFSAGQQVRFVPIDEAEFRRLGGSDEPC